MVYDPSRGKTPPISCGQSITSTLASGDQILLPTYTYTPKAPKQNTCCATYRDYHHRDLKFELLPKQILVVVFQVVSGFVRTVHVLRVRQLRYCSFVLSGLMSRKIYSSWDNAADPVPSVSDLFFFSSEKYILYCTFCIAQLIE